MDSQNYRAWLTENTYVYVVKGLHCIVSWKWIIVEPIPCEETGNSEIYGSIIFQFIVLSEEMNITAHFNKMELSWIPLIQQLNFWNHFLMIDWYATVYGHQEARTSFGEHRRTKFLKALQKILVSVNSGLSVKNAMNCDPTLIRECGCWPSLYRFPQGLQMP